ncbi:hypothetical protein [Microbispora sp. NBC_01389]|uniref:hypothetical protein n=1 Tax=Microbispora sp. NBC_01389 TaxID=2903584 RepID=UPI0032474E90
MRFRHCGVAGDGADTRTCPPYAGTCWPGPVRSEEAAAAEFRRAAGLTRNARERDLFLGRATTLPA